LTALTQLESSQLLFDDLPSIIDLLPEAVNQLPGYLTWVAKCAECLGAAVTAGNDIQPLLLQLSRDVHALLTTPKLLLHFRQLPFPAFRAWMADDELMVDSEDSIAVAVEWWARGDEGRKCSEDQLKELSGLLRVRYVLTPGKQQKVNDRMCPAQLFILIGAVFIVWAGNGICACLSTLHTDVVMLAPSMQALMFALMHCSAPSVFTTSLCLVQG
jgi:hypothetical protein